MTDQQTKTTSRQTSDISYDPSMVKCLQHGTWMDEEGFKQACIKEEKKEEASTSLSTVHG